MPFFSSIRRGAIAGFGRDRVARAIRNADLPGSAFLLSISLLPSPAALASDWNVGIGAGLISTPEYLGADDYETRAVPALDIGYKNTVFFNFYEGLSAYLYTRREWRLKAGIAWDRGRDEDDDESLAGTGDIDNSAIYHLSAEYQLREYTAFARLQQHDGGTDGTQLVAGIQAFYTLREDLASPRLLANLAINYSNRDYMQGYFGVDAAQSSASGIPEYGASAGIASARTGLTYIYPLTQSWRLTALLQYRKLLGDATDSPLVADDEQWFGGAFLGYRFR